MTRKQLSEDQVLAYTLLGEAGGESKEGQAAIIHVILNRSKASGRSAKTEAIRGNKKGVHAFSTWNNPNSLKLKYSTSSPEFQAALATVKAVKAGTISDPTGGATHYYANTGANAIDAPYWWKQESALGQPVQIGNHVFAARGPVTPNAPTPAVAGDSIKTQRALYATERVLADPNVQVAPGSPVPATATKGLKTSRAVYAAEQAIKQGPSLADLPATKEQLQAVIGKRVSPTWTKPNAPSGLVTRKINTVKVDAFGQPMEDVQPVGETTVAGRPDATPSGLPGKKGPTAPVPGLVLPKVNTPVGIETGAYHLPKIDLGMTPKPSDGKPTSPVPDLKLPTSRIPIVNPMGEPAQPKQIAQVSAAQQILNSIAEAKAKQSGAKRDVTTVVEHKSGMSIVLPKAGDVALPAGVRPSNVGLPGGAARPEIGKGGLPAAAKTKTLAPTWTTKTTMVQKTIKVKNPSYVPTPDGSRQYTGSFTPLAVDNSNAEAEFILKTVTVPKVEKILIPGKVVRVEQAAASPIVPVVQAVRDNIVRKTGFVFTQEADMSLTPTAASEAAIRRQALTGGDGMDRSAAGDSFSGPYGTDTSNVRWGPTKSFDSMDAGELTRWYTAHDEQGYERQTPLEAAKLKTLVDNIILKRPVKSQPIPGVLA